MKCDRREFIIKTGLAVITVGIFLPGISGCSFVSGKSSVPEAPEGSYAVVDGNLRIDLPDVPALQSDGGAVKLSVAGVDGADPVKVIVLNTGDNRFRAFADRCAHGGRELNYVHESETLRCSSFGRSEYDLDGRVLKGPADDNLLAYAVTMQGEHVVVAL